MEVRAFATLCLNLGSTNQRIKKIYGTGSVEQEACNVHVLLLLTIPRQATTGKINHLRKCLRIQGAWHKSEFELAF